MDYTELKNKALAEINIARLALEFPALEELPKGQPSSAHTCVVTMALQCASTSPERASFRHPETAQLVSKAWRMPMDTDGDRSVILPQSLATLVDLFDQHLLPELEA